MDESDGEPWARPAVADAPRAGPDPAGPDPAGPAHIGVDPAGPGSNGATPRLAPRPLDRPAVDADSAAAFGRPHGVSGAFSGAARATPPACTTSTR